MSSRSIQQINVQALLASCGIAGPILYVIVLVILSVLEPNYSQLSQSMSKLGADNARYNIIMNTAGFSLLGLLLIAFAAGLDHGIDTSRFSKLGPALIISLGLSLIMIGIFPCDSGSLEVTTAGKIHGAFVIIAIISMMLSLLAISPRLWGDEHWRSYVAYTMWTVLLILIVAAIYGFGVFESWEGAIQRALMGVSLIWIEVMAIRLLRLS